MRQHRMFLGVGLEIGAANHRDLHRLEPAALPLALAAERPEPRAMGQPRPAQLRPARWQYRIGGLTRARFGSENLLTGCAV